jgi:hypothetical protein
VEPSSDNDEEGARRTYGRSDAVESTHERVEEELRQLRQQVADANDLAHQWSDYVAGLQRQINEHRCPSGSGTTTTTTAQTHSVTNTVTEGAQQAPTGLTASIHAPTPSQGQTTEPAAMQLDESDFPSLQTTNASSSSGPPPRPT